MNDIESTLCFLINWYKLNHYSMLYCIEYCILWFEWRSEIVVRMRGSRGRATGELI